MNSLRFSCRLAWSGHATSVALVALVAALMQSPARAAQDEDGTAEPPVVEAIDRDIENYTRVLQTSTDHETAVWAAEGLLKIDKPAAREVLAAALASDDRRLVDVVASALNTRALSAPPDALLEPVIAALAQANDETRHLLGLVLTRYGDQALERLSRQATDPDAARESRAGAIHALGGFRTRRAVTALMTILQARPRGDEDILNATCDSLARLTRLETYGRDPQRWEAWWREARDQPEEEWLSALVTQLSTQIRDLEGEKLQQQTEIDRIAQRLFETLRELYPLLSREEQVRRLPALLEDEFTPVRQFALTRIDVLLRDGVIPEVTIQDKLADRLADPVAAIRTESGRLLDELGYPQLGERLAAAIEAEREQTVMQDLLELLARNPAAQAVPRLAELLSNDALADPAANALWSLARDESVTLPADQMGLVQEALGGAYGKRPSTAVGRVLALLGSDEQASLVEADLDGDDAALRQAVAEGLMIRGRLQPLVDRASDPAIYPYAARVLARAEATLEHLARLVGQAPPDDHDRLWRDLVAQMADRFPAGQLLAVDNLLGTHAHADLALRARVLARAADLPAGELPAAQRVPLLSRLAAHWLALDRVHEAQSALTGLNGSSDSEALRALRFEAATRSGAYDLAAGIHARPEPWVDLLLVLLERQAPGLKGMHDEIARRFTDQLQGELRQRFDVAGARIAAVQNGSDDGTGSTGPVTQADTDQ